MKKFIPVFFMLILLTPDSLFSKPPEITIQLRIYEGFKKEIAKNETEIRSYFLKEIINDTITSNSEISDERSGFCRPE